MQFGILGPVEATTAAGAPVPVGGPRPRALLALLALEVGRSVGVEQLIDAQYGDDPPAGAANAVQVHVSRLRRALGAERIELGPGGYRLVAEPDDVDAARFGRLAADGHRLLAAGRIDDAARVLREGLALWRGPALADLPGREAAAARLEELRLAAQEDLVEAELAAPGGTSIAALGELVAAYPLRERRRAQLMRALLAAGRPAEALEEYERARRRLRSELGTDPSPELAAVHRAVLRADRPAPPARRLPPAPLTTFVGRAPELARLAELAAAGARLVTLLGPGGAGKTRLASEWARRSGRESCFADLSAVTEPDGVVVALLGALGVREPGFGQPVDPVEQLVTAVSNQDLLVVVDNCEQVAGTVASLVRTLLSSAQALTVIVTSREPLGVTGESVVPLAALPDDDAVALFAQRAAAVRPDFVLDAATGPVVAGICAALDGLPLAVELAAARLRQLSLDAVARRLGPDRFGLLSRGDPTAAARHRTLAAVVAWSWDLLRPDEQRLARRFTVFAGPVLLDTVEAVCGPGSAELLAELVDRSIVTAEGERYRMLQTIRLFCAERLTDAGEEDELRAAHAAYVLDLAVEADPHLRRTGQLEWLARLAADDAELTSAVRWSAEHARPTAFSLLAALAAYWWLSGRPSTCGDVAAALLAGEPPTGMAEEYVACVVHAVPRAAPEHWARAAEIVRTRDEVVRHPFGAALWGMAAGPPQDAAGAVTMFAADPWNDALVRLSDGLMHAFAGRVGDAERETAAALDAFRALGDRWGTAQALDWLGILDGRRGRWTEAHTRWTEACGALGELGALAECADVLAHRAEALVRQGELAAAAADLDEAVELRRRSGVAATTEIRLGQAVVARLRGEPAAAAALLVDPADSRVLTLLARLAEDRGDSAAALHNHAEALAAARRSPMRTDLADAVEGVAGMASPVAAAELLGAAVALRGFAVVGDRDVAAVATAAQEALGPSAFAEAHRRGAAQTPEEIVAAAEAVLVG